MKDKVEKSKNETNSSKGSVGKDAYPKMRRDVTDLEIEKTGMSLTKRMSQENNLELPLQMAGDAHGSNKMQHDSEVHNGPEDKHGGEMIGGGGAKKKKKLYEGRNIDDETKTKKMKLKQGGHQSNITTVNTAINETEVGTGEAQLGEIMMDQRKKEKKRHKPIQGDASRDIKHNAHDGRGMAEPEGNNETAAVRAADSEGRSTYEKKKKKCKRDEDSSEVTPISINVNEHGFVAGEEQLEEGVMDNIKSPRKERKKEKKRHKELKSQDITSNSCGDGSSMVERNNVNITLTEADNVERNLKVTPPGAEDRNTDENRIKKKKKKKKKKKDSVDEWVTATRDNISANEGEEEQLEGQSGDKLKRKFNSTGNISTEKWSEADNVERNLKVTPSGAEDRNTDENMIKKKKKKKKDSDGDRVTATRDNISANEGEEEQLEGQSGDKLKRKSKSTGNITEKRRKRDKNAREDAGSKDLSEESTPKKSSKRVTFAEEVEVLEDSLVRGKRFSPEEDEIIKKAVLDYISDHNLGEQGLDMVLNCRSYPEVKNCWKEIGLAIPHRPHSSVYYRAHILFERDDNHHWTQEERELVCNFHAKHGADWKTLGKILGKSRTHVKDFWRRICLPNSRNGKWDQEEYQKLFDNVSVDLQVRALQENKSTKHGMLRDNIAWTAISRNLQTRSQDICCMKWYQQLASPMVVKGEWSDTDDYRLLKALYELDACCMEDVDWNDLIEYRSGDVCRQRWNQMVKHLGDYRTKPFPDQVNVLTERYCPSLLEAREAYDNLPVEP